MNAKRLCLFRTLVSALLYLLPANGFYQHSLLTQIHNSLFREDTVQKQTLSCKLLRHRYIHGVPRHHQHQTSITSSSIIQPDQSRSKQLVGIMLAKSSTENNLPSFSVENFLKESNDDEDLSTFFSCLQEMSLPSNTVSSILAKIQSMGWTSTNELYAFAIDFEDRPEVLSTLLQNDFGVEPLMAHQLRAALLRLVRSNQKVLNVSCDNVHVPSSQINLDPQDNSSGVNEDDQLRLIMKPKEVWNETDSKIVKDPNSNNEFTGTPTIIKTNERKKQYHENYKQQRRPLFKAVVVNQKQKERFMKSTIMHQEHSFSSDETTINYGLTPNYKFVYPQLGKELDEFMKFMVEPAASSQENPIRRETANIYLRHAKLFLGWYVKYTLQKEDDNENSNNNNKNEERSRSRQTSSTDNTEVSLFDIIPNQDAKSAQPVVDFVLWLRRIRHVSDSYESNILRGLTKLLKYRFADESIADPTYGEKSFHDIAAIRELRKLHKNAQRRQILSPRSSDESKKWLSWKEYLSVVELIKTDVMKEVEKFDNEHEEKGSKKDSTSISSTNNGNEKKRPKFTPSQRRIASMYQSYLVLAFFSCIPDRQRTFRELTIGRSFLRDETIDCWTIKHGPDDYKTGKTYGDRPPLILASELTPGIDDFLQRWRPCLLPTGDHFFLQPRTGNPLTRDSIYSIVARSCYKYGGKKTNPHLLRDMIVTHIRDSDASEKELEALALYMGHSISMQKNSYDRRTMEQKVAPAVELLRSVNSGGDSVS